MHCSCCLNQYRGVFLILFYIRCSTRELCSLMIFCVCYRVAVYRSLMDVLRKFPFKSHIAPSPLTASQRRMHATKFCTLQQTIVRIRTYLHVCMENVITGGERLVETLSLTAGYIRLFQDRQAPFSSMYARSIHSPVRKTTLSRFPCI